MKTLTHYIKEKLIIKKSTTINYNYFPQTKKELKDLINQRIEQEGNKVDLNDIDISNITDMSCLFSDPDFNGDISNWDVSNVTDMRFMFYGCKSFNQDISNWDVSNVKNMSSMFNVCKAFNQDISAWNVSKVTNLFHTFLNCPIEEKYKPKFK